MKQETREALIKQRESIRKSAVQYFDIPDAHHLMRLIGARRAVAQAIEDHRGRNVVDSDRTQDWVLEWEHYNEQIKALLNIQ